MASEHTPAKRIIADNRVFSWIALATGLLLLVPATLQLTIGTGVDGEGFNWTLSDFAMAGALIFATGSAFVFAARKIPQRYWGLLAAGVALAFLYAWAELAVGIFFHFGS